MEGVPGSPGTQLSAATAPAPTQSSDSSCGSLLHTIQASAEKKGLLSPAHCGHDDPRQKGSSRASDPTPDPSLELSASLKGQRGRPHPHPVVVPHAVLLFFTLFVCHPCTHQGVEEGQTQETGVAGLGLGQGCGAS